MTEIKNNQNSNFKPRPKPQVAGAKNNGVKPGPGGIPRPKPQMNKQMPPRPPRPVASARPMPPKPPVIPAPVKEEAKPQQNNVNSMENALNNYQYSSLLNNIQLMNAIGLVNGIYQNAQNSNRAYVNPTPSPNNFDKQTLFEEFYDYLQNKMGGDKGLDKLKDSSSNNEDNTMRTAIINAKKKGLSLDQYLEQMCSEDEFMKFALEPLKVENLPFCSAELSAVPFVKEYDCGNVVKVSDYTYEDYQNLVNQNYSVYLDELNENKEEEPKMGEIVEPEIEEVEEIEDVEEQVQQQEQETVEQEPQEEPIQEQEEIEEIEEIEEEPQAEAQEEVKEEQPVEQEQVEQPIEEIKEVEEPIEEIEEVEEPIQEEVAEQVEEPQEEVAQETIEEQQEESAVEDQTVEEQEEVMEEDQTALAQAPVEIQVEKENEFEELYKDEEGKQNPDEELKDIIEDIAEAHSEQNESEEAEDIEQVEEVEDLDAQRGFDKYKDQDLIDYLNNEEEVEDVDQIEEVEEDEPEEVDMQKYSDLVYNTIHEKELAQEQYEYMKAVAKDNEMLKTQIAELRNIVISLKKEVDDQAEENEQLKQQYDDASIINSENEQVITQTSTDNKELERENKFMKDVVESLMVEVEDLKRTIDEDNKEKPVKEEKAENKLDIIPPITEEVQEQPIEEEAIEEQIQEQPVEETVEEEQEIQEEIEPQEEAIEEQPIEEEIPVVEEDEIVQEGDIEYDASNLIEVQNTVFDEDTYNVDGIIVDEGSDEISGHFVDKIKNSPDDIKEIYNEIRNSIMSYKGVKGRCSSACDTFRLNGAIIAKFLLIGKTIKLYLALNPDDENLPQNIYHQKDESKKKAYKETPFMVRIQSDLAMRKAKKLVEYMFNEYDINPNPKYEYVDYANTLERQVVKNK